MDQNITDRINRFVGLTDSAFQFLVSDYAFKKLEPEISLHVKQDASVSMPYVGEIVGVKVVYSPYEHDIGVGFFELHKGQFSAHSSFYGHSKMGRAVTLDTLMRFRNADRSDYPLPFIAPSLSTSEMNRRFKEREILLEEDMEGVMTALAELTKRFATKILQGDVSEFSLIQAFHRDLYV